MAGIQSRDRNRQPLEGHSLAPQTFLAWPVSLRWPNPHPARELRASEKVYSDKLIMEIALCHRLLTPCSIIFYLFRVFAALSRFPGDEAFPGCCGTQWGTTLCLSFWSKNVSCPPFWKLLRELGKDRVFSDQVETASPWDRDLGALWPHSQHRRG